MLELITGLGDVLLMQAIVGLCQQRLQLRAVTGGQRHCLQALLQLIAQGALFEPVGDALDLKIQFGHLLAGRFERIAIVNLQQLPVSRFGKRLERGERLQAFEVGWHRQQPGEVIALRVDTLYRGKGCAGRGNGLAGLLDLRLVHRDQVLTLSRLVLLTNCGTSLAKLWSSGGKVCRT
nr:hypothetical protein [Pseudomonas sp. BIGb0427]